jgi:hypothetical protein
VRYPLVYFRRGFPEWNYTDVRTNTYIRTVHPQIDTNVVPVSEVWPVPKLHLLITGRRDGLRYHYVLTNFHDSRCTHACGVGVRQLVRQANRQVQLAGRALNKSKGLSSFRSPWVLIIKGNLEWKVIVAVTAFTFMCPVVVYINFPVNYISASFWPSTRPVWYLIFIKNYIHYKY